MNSTRSGRWKIALGCFVVLGIAIRINNAFAYPINLGFDAPENWRYIHALMHSWELPDPASDWSTAHPPLFYYTGAALGRLLGPHEADFAVVAIRLFDTFMGLVAIALCFGLVRRVDPTNPRRAFLAATVLLFLPAALYMSAMLNEEILASSLVTFVAVGAALAMNRPSPTEGKGALRCALALGVGGGLALLTKASGILVVLAAAAAGLLAGWRRRSLRPALLWSGVLLAAALVVGGWFYGRNWLHWGYFYPQDLPVHEVMFTMPPGERSVGDYLYVPLATWTDPQLVHPDLLRSVWGSTYVSVWFDGHRHYLARESPAVTRAGTFILLLALLPTAAFFVGLWRGARRAIASPISPDTPLLFLTGLTFAGYVAFTAGNPWFAAVKGSYLLGLAAPFSFYASEVLADWTRGRNTRSVVVWAILASLFLAIVVVFTYGPVYWNWAGRGIEWTRIPSTMP